MAATDTLTTRRKLGHAVRNSLMLRGGRRGPGKTDANGRAREKVRHSCLFHDDPQPSADFYADEGWYYCHGCGAVYPLEDVARALQLDVPEAEIEEARHGGGGLRTDGGSNRSAHHHSKFGEPDAVYVYRHPRTLRPSHYKCRWNVLDDDGRVVDKNIRTQGADHSWSGVEPTWPIYGDATLWPGLNIVVCEGEKAVGRLNARAEAYEGGLIVAVTCGSAESLLQHCRRLADRLAELAPARVLVWPDNDHRRQTVRWVPPLQRALQALGVTVGRVELAPLDLPPKAGPDDFCDRGGSLADVFGATFTVAGSPTLEQLEREVVVTEDGRFLMPGSRRLLEPKNENLEALWCRHTGGQVPGHTALRLLRAKLLSRGVDSRTRVAYRRWHDAENTCLYWRPHPDGHCYRVDSDGIHTAYDPPETLLMAESGRFTPDVDENGSMEDLELLCQEFGLGHDDAVLLLGWLCCALVGLQVPILVLRGEAGAGKTTLARLLMAILEPVVHYISLPSDNRGNFDSRQFVEALRRSVGVVVDNVTRFAPDAEDLLSQVVTGYGVSQRRLNTHDIEFLNMRRAVIVTTIHWDVKKGDLSTRLLPIHLEDRFEYIPEREIERRFNPLLERVRGFVFQAAHEFFLMADSTPPQTHIRIADLGFVLACLGYDSVDVADRLHRMRASILNETDAWTGAVADFYRSHYNGSRPQPGDFFTATSYDIVSHMLEAGCEGVPSHRSSALARWLRERNPMFRDSGFKVEYFREALVRGWRFHSVRGGDW